MLLRLELRNGHRGTDRTGLPFGIDPLSPRTPGDWDDRLRLLEPCRGDLVEADQGYGPPGDGESQPSPWRKRRGFPLTAGYVHVMAGTAARSCGLAFSRCLPTGGEATGHRAQEFMQDELPAATFTPTGGPESQSSEIRTALEGCTGLPTVVDHSVVCREACLRSVPGGSSDRTDSWSVQREVSAAAAVDT